MTRLQIMHILNETLRIDMISSMPIVAGQGLACERILAAMSNEKKQEAVLGEFTGGVDIEVQLNQVGSQRKGTKIAVLCDPGEIIFRPKGKKP